MMTHFSEIYYFGACYYNEEMTKIRFVADWRDGDYDTPIMHDIKSFTEARLEIFIKTEVNGIKDFIENYTCGIVDESPEEDLPLMTYPISSFIIAVSE